MHSWEKKAHRDDKFLNPSFSSTLLDKIYRSMDEGERKSGGGGEMKFFRETPTAKKQNRSSNNVKCNRNMVEEEQAKRKDKNVGKEKPCFVLPTHHHGIYHRDHDQDALFFSSTSISSDSSSGGFSSSDTESSMYGAMSRASCFAPPPPKPNKPVVKKKNIEKQKQATPRMFDGFCHNSKTGGVSIHDDDDVDDEKALFKSKLRALKIYNNLKKVKQPISPGGRLTSFLNSLFANNAKKTRTSSSSCYYEDMNIERKAKVQASSACSSASSFSRSCLSKTSSCEREKMFNGVKRTVSFQPVNVSVDEEEGKSLKGLNLKIGRSNTKKKKEEESKLPVLEKSRVVEEAAREFLEEYHLNRKSDLPLRSFSAPFETVATAGAKRRTIIVNDDDEGDDDDAASYASSDLFELDHLAVLGNGRYCEELPVYETTHVSTNRAIVNGLVM